MRIYLMLSYDVIFKPRLLHQILLRCPGQIIGVAEVRKKQRKRNKKNNACGPFAFWGLKGMIFLAFTVFLHKLVSALPFPNYLRCRSTIKRVANFYKIPYALIDDVNDRDFIEHLKVMQSDIVVSFQHQIFKKELLKLPKISCLNCHPAKLPKFRGIKPIFWAMLEGEREIGVTVHTMEPEIDAGRIVSQKCFSVIPDSTLIDNYFMAYSISCDVIIDALEKIRDGFELSKFPSVSRDDRYFKHPTRQDVEKFRDKGLRIL